MDRAKKRASNRAMKHFLGLLARHQAPLQQCATRGRMNLRAITGSFAKQELVVPHTP